jgi:glycosyltransferase involved in cell wall biosynthesis
MTAPLVSILVPCFNGVRFIGETLESALAQTWPRIEVIVVDDGSEDESVREIERFKSRNVQLIRQQNRGQTAALNVCLAHAKGDFIQYLDADDLISPTKIELQVARLVQAPKAVAVAEWGRFRKSYSEAKFEKDRSWADLDPLDWLHANMQRDGGMMFPAMWLIPSDITRCVGPWNESLTLNNDAEYLTRAILLSERVLFCPAALAYYRSGNLNTLSGLKTPKGWASQFKVIELCQEYIFSVEPSQRMSVTFAHAWQRLAHASYPYDRKLANRALERALQLYPVEGRAAGGPKFQAVAKIVGWRAARKIQVWAGRK